MNARNPHAKSCIRTYNDTPQLLSKDPEILTIEGVAQVYSGCSLTLTPKGVQVNNPGLYHFSADVTFTPTGGLAGPVQLYLDGKPLPSTFTQTELAKGPYTMHVETELCLHTCCMNHPIVGVGVTDIEGTVSHVTFGALKLA